MELDDFSIVLLILSPILDPQLLDHAIRYHNHTPSHLLILVAHPLLPKQMKKTGLKQWKTQKIHPFTSGPNPRMRMNLMKRTSFRVSRLVGWWLICLDLRWKVRPAWGVLGNGSNWSNLCFAKMTPCCSQIYTRLSELQTSSFSSPGWWLDWFAWTFSKSCWLLSWSPGTF